MGRPRLYANRAAQQAAYRMRQSLSTGSVVRWLEALISQGATFGSVLLDPPWDYGNRATRAAATDHYQTMRLADIAALPVGKLAAPNAHCHLWTTTSFHEASYALLRGWGFEPKSELIWCKPMGLGNYYRVSHETCLLGVKGRATFQRHDLKSWFTCARGEHSSKPDQVRQWIQHASPGPYLEVFGRRAVPGWTVMGDTITTTLFD